MPVVIELVNFTCALRCLNTVTSYSRALQTNLFVCERDPGVNIYSFDTGEHHKSVRLVLTQVLQALAYI